MDPLGALLNKYFDPIINAKSYDDIRAWVRQQEPDEVEQFLRSYGWKYDEDRKVVVEQELARLRSAPRSLSDLVEAKPGWAGVTFDLKGAWQMLRRRLIGH